MHSSSGLLEIHTQWVLQMMGNRIQHSKADRRALVWKQETWVSI